MKKFLLHIGTCVIVVYLIFLGIDTLITNNLHHSDARMFRNWNEVFYDSTNYDLLISGSSRAWVFYNPMILDSILNVNSYNLGLDGHGITTQVARYHAYRTTHPKPKCVVQTIDFFTLQSSNKFEREQFLPYMMFDGLYDEIHEEEGYTYIDKYVPFVRYIGYRDVIFESLGLPNDIVRYSNLYKGFATSEACWDPSIPYTTDSLVFTCEERPKEIFEAFLRELREDSIEVVLIYGPIYRGNMYNGPSGQEQKMYAYFEDCAERYGCFILNYLWDDICASTEYFYNATHVNAKGSRIVSEKLAHDLDSLKVLE